MTLPGSTSRACHHGIGGRSAEEKKDTWNESWIRPQNPKSRGFGHSPFKHQSHRLTSPKSAAATFRDPSVRSHLSLVKGKLVGIIDLSSPRLRPGPDLGSQPMERLKTFRPTAQFGPPQKGKNRPVGGRHTRHRQTWNTTSAAQDASAAPRLSCFPRCRRHCPGRDGHRRENA